MKDELARQNPTRVRQIYYGNISYWYNPLKIAQVLGTVKIIHVPPVKLDILNERAGAELFRSEVSWSKIYQIGICSFEAQFCHFLAQIWEKSNNPSRGAHDGTLKR